MGNEQGNAMYFDPSNAAGATVHDVDRLERLEKVTAIDTERGWVYYSPQPVSIDRATGRIREEVIRFKTIHPIWGLDRRPGWPVMFHCYGRLN
jgi:hypothetical protein